MRDRTLRTGASPIRAALCLVAVLAAGSALAGPTKRVSVGSRGLEANDDSYYAELSASGRYVAFESDASNLVADDTNGSSDVFVHDRRTGKTRRASVDSSGLEGEVGSYGRALSANGRMVGFSSRASNLVPVDTNGADDVFVHDRKTGETTRVSVDSAGLEGDGDSHGADLSTDGRFVAFHSEASNLVGDDTNGVLDVFVHDRGTGQTTRVSVDSAGLEGNGESGGAAISEDGRFVAFQSYASNLVVGDGNEAWDVFVHDRETGATTRVSVDSAGLEGSGDSDGAALSADGRFVTFGSGSSSLVPADTNWAWDVFVRDRETGETTRVSIDSAGLQGEGASYGSALSSNGRFVVFDSCANNLVPDDTNGACDVFVHDREARTTRRVSTDSAGRQGNASSGVGSAISANGRFVAFGSVANNLVRRDENGRHDVFVHDRRRDGKPVLLPAGVLAGPILNPGNGHSYYLLDAASWAESHALAGKLGGHLVTIDDADEQAFVFGKFNDYGDELRNLWIGLHDSETEGIFEWVNGAPISFVFWGAEEPDAASPGEDVAIMLHALHPGTPYGQWADVEDGVTFDSHPIHGVVEVP